MKKSTLGLLLLLLVCNVQFAQSYVAVQTFSGTGTASLTDGALNTAEFNGPYSICDDPATGTLYIADALNHSIRKIQNGIVSTLAGNGTQGDVLGQASAARFFVPTGICFSNGFVYITDNGNNKIKRIDASGNVTLLAGSGTAGFQNGSATNARFFNPVGLTADAAGDIYVADFGNHCVRKIANGTVTTFAGTGGVSGDQLGSAASALFNRPSGLCFDNSGALFIADQSNNKIKKLSGGQVTLLAGSGSLASIDGTGSSASFDRPAFIDIDQAGNVYATEWSSNNIRRISQTGVVTTIAGSGTPGFTNGSPLSATFDSPYGVCVTSSGIIYIGDKNNNAIRTIIPSEVIGIAESIDVDTITAYPTLASSQLTIHSPENQPIKELIVFDASGKIVMQSKFENELNNQTLSIQELANGHYIVCVVLSEKRIAKRFIKM